MINNAFLLNSKTKNFDLKLTFDHDLQFAKKMLENLNMKTEYLGWDSFKGATNFDKEEKLLLKNF
ncbi:hypothetical protein BpHYR1_046817 [Brachionus plicatilis]|uniref:Uncharacterized protein n=1 Tax=Brachionus plicatilis TaxID=10195 RepID=A0A3M7RNG7_BRAPC|nr:hypothetical protein BpHYR1_046817 [Brachionus plicatilis]